LQQIDFKGASGMIKFLAGSCLSGLGIVLKESYAIQLYGYNSLNKQRTLWIDRAGSFRKNLIISEAVLLLKG
jgi:hypothetical protein